jgi:hypothetical protein
MTDTTGFESGNARDRNLDVVQHCLMPTLKPVLALAAACIVLAGCSDLPLLSSVRSAVLGTPSAVYVAPDGTGSGYAPDDPIGDIDRALELAAEWGAAEVQVAGGGYSVPEGIYLVPGVSLLGGYSPDFSERDWNVYESRLTALLETGGRGFTAIGPEFTQETAVEGFTFEYSVSGEPVHDVWSFSAVLSIEDGASLLVRHNRFELYNSVTQSEAYPDRGFSAYVIGINASGDPTFTETLLKFNEIWLKSDGSDFPATALFVDDSDPGSRVVLDGNRFAVKSFECDAMAMDIGSLDGGFLMRNNVVNCQATNSGAAVSVSSPGAILAHNTIVSRGHGIDALGLSGEADAFAYAVNNIVVGDGTGYAIAGGNTEIEGNLVFNFSEGLDSGLIDLGTNDSYADDLFVLVFSTALDANLDDGDHTDYHLSDVDGLYAVDLGVPSGAQYAGSVDTDFEGDARPQGAAVDRGADEKVP